MARPNCTILLYRKPFPLSNSRLILTLLGISHARSLASSSSPMPHSWKHEVGCVRGRGRLWINVVFKALGIVSAYLTHNFNLKYFKRKN
jgi:hypothetical protein